MNGLPEPSPEAARASTRRVRVLVTKLGLDGHDRGAKLVCAFLREAGMEVVYLGAFQTVEGVAKTALEEDIDVVGLSSHCGEHAVFVPKLKEALGRRGLGDIALVVGGVIPPEDVPSLEELGVAGVFVSGTSMREIVEGVREAAGGRRS